ncbi:MAG TPA: hypothetical protein VF834_04165 [Streptosporangiaceae bacterium]
MGHEHPAGQGLKQKVSRFFPGRGFGEIGLAQRVHGDRRRGRACRAPDQAVDGTSGNHATGVDGHGAEADDHVAPKVEPCGL